MFFAVIENNLSQDSPSSETVKSIKPNIDLPTVYIIRYILAPTEDYVKCNGNKPLKFLLYLWTGGAIMGIIIGGGVALDGFDLDIPDNRTGAYNDVFPRYAKSATLLT